MGIVHAKSAEADSRNNPNRRVNYEHCESNTKEIELEGVKARVDKIHIDGLQRTKNDIIEDCLNELFTASDFQDVLVKAHRTRLKLDELGCFKNIAVFIDTSKGIGATPDGLEVTFNVKEYKRLTGGVSTQVGDNEGSLLVGLRAPNLFGRGERVQVEYSHGSKRTSNFNVAFIKPFRGTYRPVFTASVFQSHYKYPSSGYKELDRGILLDLGFHSHPLIKHNIQWEGSVRDLGALGKGTSFDVLEQVGVTLKSSIRHILSADFRDDAIFPSGGSFLQLTSEFAGLGGDVGFLKNDFFAQANFSLFEDIVFQTSLSGGYMTSLNDEMKIGLSDMYYLGGPLNLRGFDTRGCGPHSDGDALGSLAYYSAGLHLFTPLPFRPGKGGFGELFRTHLFVNAGGVTSFTEEAEQPEDGGNPLVSNMRLSYGMGLALRLGNMARIEVNYCFPLYYQKSDVLHPGVQFGIGVQFL